MWGQFIQIIFPKRIIKGFKNITYLTLGNLISQFIAFLGFIFIARFLGPTGYGYYVTVISFVGLFTILTFQGLNKVVIREGAKDLSQMKYKLEKVIGIRNSLSLISIIVCIGLAYVVSYEDEVLIYIIIYSTILIYQSLNGLIDTVFQASEKMHFIAIISIINKIIFVSSGLLFLYFGYGIFSLIIINIISSFITLGLGYYYSNQIVPINLFSKIIIDKRLIKFGLIFSFLGLTGYLTKQIDIVMLSFLTTSENVGIYGVAYRTATIGLTLRNIITTAFFPIFIKEFKQRTVSSRLLIKYSLLFLFGLLLISFILYYFIEDVIVFLFGVEYVKSAFILRILIFYLAFWWATIPFTTAAQAVYKENLILYARVIMAILNIILNYVLFLWYGLYGIAYSTLIVFSVGSFIISVIVYRVLKKEGYLR